MAPRNRRNFEPFSPHLAMPSEVSCSFYSSTCGRSTFLILNARTFTLDLLAVRLLFSASVHL